MATPGGMTDDEIIRSLNILGKPTAFQLTGAPGTSDPTSSGIPAPPNIGGGPGMGGPGQGGGPSGIAPPRSISPERSNLPALGEESGLGLSGISKIAGHVLGLGKKIGDLTGQPGSFEMSPETRAAYEAQRAGERVLPVATAPTDFAAGLAALQAETPGVLGAVSGPLEGLVFASPETGAAAGGALGEAFNAGASAPDVAGGGLGGGLGGAVQIGGSVLGTALSAYKAAMADNDFDKARAAVHAALYAASPFTFGISGVAAGIADAIDAIVQAFGGPTVGELFGFGPTEEWLSFGKRLQGNLGTTGTALEQLGMDIVNAGDEQAIQDAIGRYTKTIGGFAGDFGVGEKYGGRGSGIPIPPGATGMEHEGGITANWEDAVTQMEGILAAKRAALAGPGAQEQAAGPAPLPAAAEPPPAAPAAEAAPPPRRLPVVGRGRGVLPEQDEED